MPGSNFPDASAGPRHDTALMSRWDTTHDGSHEDERRVSLDENGEMDDVELYDRPDWPLGPGLNRAVSPETAQELQREEKGKETNHDGSEDSVTQTSDGLVSQLDRADHDTEEAQDNANGGSEPERTGSVESDTIDRSAKAEDDQRKAQVERNTRLRDRPPDKSSRSHSPLNKDGSNTREETGGAESPVSSTGKDVSRHDREPPLQRQAQGKKPDVSPIPNSSSDNEGSSVSPAKTRARRRSLRLPSLKDAPEGSPARQPQFDLPMTAEQEEHVNGFQEKQDKLGALRERNAYETNSTSHPSNGHEDESSDLVTPITFGSEHGNGDSTPRPHAPSTPQMNGTSGFATNGHSRVGSSTLQTPPSRSLSMRRGSLSHNTTQIPHNKDRVRYSWQSLQDDEPNRPRIHIMKLVSETATASAGFPGGEAFGFSISPGGRRIAAYNSARLYVLQTAALPVGISQDYALKRRPLAVEIVDDGDVMAILADEHTINVYELGHQRLKRTNTIKLDFPTNCIALAPTGGLLAAAYEGGVEIFSLDPSALPTDRRAVRSQKMDRMTFSEDGSTLLGTTTRINVSSTVIVSVPMFPAAPNGLPTHAELKEAWCSELLHPENIRNSSHATFMREKRVNSHDRIFAWNGLEDTFGVLSISDMQYGNLDFPIAISPPLSTCGGLGAAIHSCPAIDEHGDTIAMIVNDRTIRLYIVPQKNDDHETAVEAHSIDHELDEGYGCPFSEARWVYNSALPSAPIIPHTRVQGRLVVTSPGGVVEPGLRAEEAIDDIEGGRIILFDFDPQFAGQPGQTFNVVLGKSPPQLLEEAPFDVASEVALVRRRTVHQSKTGGLSQRPVMLGRAASTVNNSRGAHGSTSSITGQNSGRRSGMSIHSIHSEAGKSLPDLLETNETNDTLEVLEEPYAQNAPRSHASMQRAASNAQRHRFQALEERVQERVSADSNGHFLALPEYTEEPNAPLPSRFRAMAGLDGPAIPSFAKPLATTDMNGATASSISSRAGAASVPSTTLRNAPSLSTDSSSQDQAFGNAAARSYSPLSQDVPPSQDHIRSGSVSALSWVPASPSIGPPGRTGTFDSINAMPRSLQRAYSNATTGLPPSLVGDWEDVSPIMPSGSQRSFTPTRALVNGRNSPSAVPEDDEWSSISPVAGPSHQATSFARSAQPARLPFRYSTSLLNPPGHLPPNRLGNAAPSFNGMSGATPVGGASRTLSSAGTGGGRVPPHVQNFRNATSTSASASLFPRTEASDHVPLRQSRAKAGAVAHPITAWHPPAASSPGAVLAPVGSLGKSLPTSPGLKPSGSLHRRHSRKSSASAFATTSKAKKLGFFKKKRAPPFLQAGASAAGYDDDGLNRVETRSMFTTMSKREKCVLM